MKIVKTYSTQRLLPNNSPSALSLQYPTYLPATSGAFNSPVLTSVVSPGPIFPTGTAISFSIEAEAERESPATRTNSVDSGHSQPLSLINRQNLVNSPHEGRTVPSGT